MLFGVWCVPLVGVACGLLLVVRRCSLRVACWLLVVGCWLSCVRCWCCVLWVLHSSCLCERVLRINRCVVVVVCCVLIAVCCWLYDDWCCVFVY